MTNELRRILLFLVGCMGARFAIVYVAYVIPGKFLPWMSVPALAIAVGFSLIYINGWRKTGLETGGQPIWWDGLRPIHASLWFLFALLAFKKDRRAWMVLLLDTLIGLAAFTFHHIKK